MVEVSKGEKRELSISDPVRLSISDSGKTIEVGIDEGRSKKMQLNMIADALHLRAEKGNRATVIKVRLGNCNESVRQEIDRLREAAKGVKLELDRTVEAPLRSLGDKYAIELARRLDEKKPELLETIEAGVNDSSLQTYCGLTSKRWDGRVLGLTVLKLDRDGKSGVIEVGGVGDISGDSTAAKAKRELGLKPGELGFRFPRDAAPRKGFSLITEKQAISKVVNLCRARNKIGNLGSAEREHKLEAAVLGGSVDVRAGRAKLKPTEVAKQFPTRWSNSGGARYLDALMMDRNKKLWAVELKVSQGGKDGRYLRHGIAQVVLYREFIRKDQPICEFFQDQLGLDSTACEAAVAFPEFDRYPEVVDGLKSVASVFDVELITLDAPGFGPEPRPK